MSVSVLSGLGGWDKSRFEAYAKLLLLKSGRQIEGTSDFTEIVDEQMELSDPDNSDSVKVNILSRFNEDKLKRAFLDRLSEFVANKRGGYHVTSSLMIEWPDRVDILVARNTELHKKGMIVEMLETITSNLRAISRLNRHGRSSDLPSVLQNDELIKAFWRCYLFLY